ncbi:class I SAM-dependent DNA methyltransferase, partial [Patescibacteria group bacterium]|nr:class I SAM-dependent DNA methyltransferase [Patescibacteria group bacterium]
KWYELQANPSLKILDSFTKEKIVWGELSDKAKFVYEPNGYYLDATVFLMIGKDIKYILAILNSRLGQWYFEQISTSSGMGTNRWKKYKIETFPIKKNQEKTEDIINATNDILDITSVHNYDPKNPPEKQRIIEIKIDEMVMNLYELTDEEKEIIRNS